MAATANHNIPDDVAVGSTLYGTLHPEPDADHAEEQLTLRLVQRCPRLDSAFLECAHYSSSFLPRYQGSLRKLLDSAAVQQMMLCTFKLGIEEDLPEFRRYMTVWQAYGVDGGKHGNHLLFQCPAWAGDSGSALLVQDGQLVGIHLETVNALKERLRLSTDFDERLGAIESSIDELVSSAAHGCVALLASTFPSGEQLFGRRT